MTLCELRERKGAKFGILIVKLREKEVEFVKKKCQHPSAGVEYAPYLGFLSSRYLNFRLLSKTIKPFFEETKADQRIKG